MEERKMRSFKDMVTEAPKRAPKMSVNPRGAELEELANTLEIESKKYAQNINTKKAGTALKAAVTQIRKAASDVKHSK